MQLDVPEAPRGKLPLRRVQVHLRQPEAEPALKPVAGAACEAHEAACTKRIADGRGQAALPGLEAGPRGRETQLRPAGLGTRSERAIERHAIDHRGQRRRRRVLHGQTGGETKAPPW